MAHHSGSLNDYTRSPERAFLEPETLQFTSDLAFGFADNDLDGRQPGSRHIEDYADGRNAGHGLVTAIGELYFGIQGMGARGGILLFAPATGPGVPIVAGGGATFLAGGTALAAHRPTPRPRPHGLLHLGPRATGHTSRALLALGGRVDAGSVQDEPPNRDAGSQTGRWRTPRRDASGLG